MTGAMSPVTDWQSYLEEYWRKAGQADDPAHDIGHVKRVVRLALKIGEAEDANLDVIEPAAWLHDLVNLPKDNPDRHLASARSADAAVIILEGLGCRDADIQAIQHAITAHSFSAGVTPETLEAKVVQDADRLDAIGAIAIARTFSTNGQLGRTLWHENDPFAEHRALDDRLYGLDHFFAKLFKLPDMMQTKSGRRIAADRAAYMSDYLTQLKAELVGA